MHDQKSDDTSVNQKGQQRNTLNTQLLGVWNEAIAVGTAGFQFDREGDGEVGLDLGGRCVGVPVSYILTRPIAQDMTGQGKVGDRTHRDKVEGVWQEVAWLDRSWSVFAELCDLCSYIWSCIYVCTYIHTCMQYAHPYLSLCVYIYRYTCKWSISMYAVCMHKTYHMYAMYVYTCMFAHVSTCPHGTKYCCRNLPRNASTIPLPIYRTQILTASNNFPNMSETSAHTLSRASSTNSMLRCVGNKFAFARSRRLIHGPDPAITAEDDCNNVVEGWEKVHASPEYTDETSA